MSEQLRKDLERIVGIEAVSGGQAVRPRRLGWARLLRRVLQVDAPTCAKCSAAMAVMAFISGPGRKFSGSIRVCKKQGEVPAQAKS